MLCPVFVGLPTRQYDSWCIELLHQSVDALSLLSAMSPRIITHSSSASESLTHHKHRVGQDRLLTHRVPFAANVSVFEPCAAFRPVSCGPWWDAWNVERLGRVNGDGGCSGHVTTLMIAQFSESAQLPQPLPVRFILPSRDQLTTALCSGQSACSIISLPLFASPHELATGTSQALDFIVFSRHLLARTLAVLTGAVAECRNQSEVNIDDNFGVELDGGQGCFLARIERDATVTNGELKFSLQLCIRAQQSNASNPRAGGSGDCVSGDDVAGARRRVRAGRAARARTVSVLRGC